MIIKRALMAIISITLVLTLFPLKITTANNECRMYVYPSPPLVSTAAPGNYFTIQLQVADAPLTYTWAVGLRWNPDILNCTNVIEGSFMKAGGRITHFTKNINNTAGNLLAVGGLQGEPRDAQVSGSGTLALCTFVVNQLGETVLNISRTELCDIDNHVTSPKGEDGLFVYPVAALEVSKIVDSSKTEGTNITVNIRAINIEDLKGFEFKLSYTKTVLAAKEVELKPFPQPNINETYINATAAYIYVNVTLCGTAEPISGNRTLASITFQVEQNKTASALTFFDTNINATGHVGWISSYFTNIVHDVAVTITSVSPAEDITIGDSVEITVESENKLLATQNETFKVKVRAGAESVDTIDVESLRPGDSKIFTVTWNTTSISISEAVSYEIKAQIDVITETVNNVILTETNTTDNQFIYGSILVKPVGGIFVLPIEYIAIVIIIVVIVIAVLVYLKKRKHT
jgi:hypothetical protein